MKRSPAGQVIDDLVFGACNTGPSGQTVLSCRVLDPQRDERRVNALLALGDLRARLAAGPLTLRGPRQCRLALQRGPRAGTVRDVHGIGSPHDAERIPIGALGPTARPVVEAMLAAAGVKACFDVPPTRAVLTLASAEVQQMILRVLPEARLERSAFLVEVKHWGDRAKKRFIGGFVALLG